MDSTCFQVQSIKKKEKHGKYSAEAHKGKYSTQYMKSIWKLQYDFADAEETALRDSSTRCDSYIFALLRFDVVKNSICIVSFHLVL